MYIKGGLVDYYTLLMFVKCAVLLAEGAACTYVQSNTVTIIPQRTTPKLNVILQGSPFCHQTKPCIGYKAIVLYRYFIMSSLK